MDWTVCSRETECDYTWVNSPGSNHVSEYAQSFFAPAFEGSLTTSRFASLLRCPGVSPCLTLSVSVSTPRRDFRNRPIRTMTFLRAEKPEEADLLARFFAECLLKSDALTIYNTESDIAKAVDSLYKTKKLDDFLQFCRLLPRVTGGGVKLTDDRQVIPRDDTAARCALTESLPALIGDNKPFLLALTDRLPTDVLGSLGSMFDHAVIRIFSKATTTPEKLPEPVLQKHRRAAAIGGVALLALLVAAIGIFPRERREGETKFRGTTEQQIPQIFGENDTDPSKWPWSSCYACHQQYTTSRNGNSKRSVRPTDWWTCSSSDTNALTQDVTDTNIHPTSQYPSDGPATSAATKASPKEAKGASHL